MKLYYFQVACSLADHIVDPGAHAAIIAEEGRTAVDPQTRS